jgi:hypothetical protein
MAETACSIDAWPVIMMSGTVMPSAAIISMSSMPEMPGIM